jgi:flavin-dependent dehydrogenase
VVEVIVAGAGPAGAVAALVLARSGVRVLLVDQARLPRPKLCGGALNPGALDLLRHLGLREAVETRGISLDGMTVTMGCGVAIAARYRDSGLSVSRDVLDELLVKAAASAGAQVQEQVRVVEPIVDAARGGPVVRGAVLATTRGRLRVPAAWTIAADGRQSVLAFGLGLGAHPRQPWRWAVGARFSGVSSLSARGELHLRRGHYVGVAPLSTDLANAYVVTADRRKLARPVALLGETLDRDPLLRDRFARAASESPVVCLGPLAVDARACGMEGLLLAGDAAGCVDPVTGDGLESAMLGGRLAAEAILRAQERPAVPAHRWLARARGRMFTRRERLDRALRRFVVSEAGLTVGAFAARLAPGVMGALFRSPAGAPRHPRA